MSKRPWDFIFASAVARKNLYFFGRLLEELPDEWGNDTYEKCGENTEETTSLGVEKVGPVLLRPMSNFSEC